MFRLQVVVQTPGELTSQRRLLTGAEVNTSQSLMPDGSILLQYTAAQARSFNLDIHPLLVQKLVFRLLQDQHRNQESNADHNFRFGLQGQVCGGPLLLEDHKGEGRTKLDH